MWQRMKRKMYGVLVGACVLLASSDAAAQGCAMCRTAIGSADDPLANGFFWSIMFLVSAPYTVIGSVGGWLIYRHLVAARAGKPEHTNVT